jgi:large subunit ribosomal protein L32
MALPKRRKSHARVRTRQQQWRATPVTKTTCPHCEAVILTHRACERCGYYNGRQVVPARNQGSSHNDAS